MPTPAWDDLEAFVNPDDFAVAVLVTRQDGTVLTFSGIFDEPYLNAQIGEYEADTARPRVTCRASEVQGVRRGDTVRVDGRNFDVLSTPQFDGTGMAVLDMAPQSGVL